MIAPGLAIYTLSTLQQSFSRHETFVVPLGTFIPSLNDQPLRHLQTLLHDLTITCVACVTCPDPRAPFPSSNR
ncbi:hypothetical protein N658DRAFT_270982 [Parathielavia hyrcaniae]|uniref:Uncharacterized protein n=1 Tax=Parathielavia hyrcaniae TaxID=113614 RepID=A0AAN6PTP1_9PEZI|nr:hypothetical protein N658DRAFT_270982 [Parathielavia hyrcaniae]